jgi:ribosomal protein L11 methyltransferase
MAWQQLICQLESKHLPLLESLLEEHDALSITYEDAEDHPIFEPKPGEMPLWDTTIIKALFESDQNLDPLLEQIPQLSDIHRFYLEQLDDQPWERAWLEHFKPICFGNGLWISPHNQSVPDDAKTIVWLDPGLAFGTGTHATTALCLKWLAHHDMAHQSVVDFGCGSGILAIAAAKLGAEQVIAIDNDPQALTATENNALANAVSHRLQVVLPEHTPDIMADVVIANILANTLIELKEAILGLCRENGHIVMSGILANQTESVQNAYSDAVTDWKIDQHEDWICLSGRLYQRHQ